MLAPSNSAIPQTNRPIESAADGVLLIDHLSDVMDALLRLIEEETELVRNGRLRDAATLAPAKSGLARFYFADLERIKAHAGFLQAHLPERLAALRQQHKDFSALLQINLTVLATAHAVSETIIRTVAGDLASKSSPETYGPTGQPRARGVAGTPPVAVSRRL